MTDTEHQKFEELMQDYIDGSLSASDKAFCEKHLSVCGECREKHEAMKFMLDECAELDEDVPDGFEDFIMNGIELEKKRKNAFKLAFIRPLIGAAACFVLVAVGYFVIVSGSMGKSNAKADMAATDSTDTKSIVTYNYTDETMEEEMVEACEDDCDAGSADIDAAISAVNECVSGDYSGIIICRELPEGYEEKIQSGDTVIALYEREEAVKLLKNGAFGEGAYKIEEGENFSADSGIISAVVVND